MHSILVAVLSSDYVQCLNYLMKYPDTVDVTFVIRYALYVKDTRVCLYFVHLDLWHLNICELMKLMKLLYVIQKYAAPLLCTNNVTSPKFASSSFNANRTLSNHSHEAKTKCSTNVKKKLESVSLLVCKRLNPY